MSFLVVGVCCFGAGFECCLVLLFAECWLFVVVCCVLIVGCFFIWLLLFGG